MVYSRTVNWSEFPDIYGDTEAIPAALGDIRSDNPETRQQAYRRLASRVVSQGSRCAASAVVAEILIDVVADTDAPDRFFAMQVLVEIAIGDEEFWFVHVPDPAARRNEINRKLAMTVAQLEQERAEWVAAGADYEERRARQLTANSEDVEDELEMEAADMAAYDAVRAGVPVYLAALQTEDPPVRLQAAYLLSWFPEEHAAIIPALSRVIANDPEPFVAATAAVAAGRCAQQPDEPLIHALRTRMTAENLAERWSAVIGLAYATLRPNRTVLEELYHCMLDAPGPVPYWPFLAGDISAMAAAALAKLGPELAGERVEILVPRLLDTPSSPKRFEVLGALLEAACPDGVSAPAHLTEPQREAVHAILQTSIWNEGPIARRILGHYRMPADGRTLQAWLD